MSETKQRIARVRDELAELEIDALVVWQPHNRRYLSGFTGTTGILVITADQARMITDSRYFGQVERECPEFQLDRVDSAAYETLAGVLSELGVERPGFEAATVTVAELQRLEEAVPDVEWIPTKGVVESHRAVKSPQELSLLEAAVRLTDEAMAFAFTAIQPGMTEKDLAWRLEAYMRENGAEAMAFDIIVAAGENSALPHHRPTDRTIGAGEPIVIDMGAQLDGYCGDLTRTFSIGPVDDPEYAEVYGLVDRANQAASAGIHSGVTGPEADAIARDIIADADYGDFFGHGLGHGVGLYIHELPRLGRTAGDEPLRAGMAVTVEPGIYLEGRFGVRLEDVVVVRDDGVTVLSKAVKEPIVTG